MVEEKQRKQANASVLLGLTREEAAASRRKHGANILSKQKRKGFFARFLTNLGDPVIRILLGALVLNLLMMFRRSDWVETLGIAAAVLLATLISTLSEVGSDRAFAALEEADRKTLCRVIRSGKTVSLPQNQVVVGDLILLSAGEGIPADGRLIQGEIRTDQSAMTGESREMKKWVSGDPSMTPSAPSSMFRGCSVTAGEGIMEVTAVGDSTLLGEISKEIQAETRDSPLKVRLSKLARQISALGYLAAALAALAYLFHVFILDSGMREEIILYKLRDLPYLIDHLLHALTLALTVIVVAVPEGLPMMIAVVLSANIRRMLKDQVLVRKPAGIEAAGSMNILFTDKTGTLTRGQMQVTHYATGAGEIQETNAGMPASIPLSLLLLSCRNGGGAVMGRDEKDTLCPLGGNPTDRALLQFALLQDAKSLSLISRLPFDSAKKYAAATLSTEKGPLTLVWGAPERLLPHLGSVMDERGKSLPPSHRVLQRTQREMTQRGLRVLAFCLVSGGVRASDLEGTMEAPLCFLGYLGLSDPVRPEARKSVEQLHRAGIGVVMITGDNRDTATVIAKASGILTPERDLVLEGEDLERMGDERLKSLLPRMAVIARAMPTHKSRLVRLSEEAGLVTGMTGDGINDAPALKMADIGFAMGSGTQVAKDAGDILILDDNLASIVRAVLYGRTIFKSIRKFITLQLTMNLSAMGVTMICPLLGLESPVTVVQMLWINLVMDTLGGLAFAGEAPLDDTMQEPPKRREEPILSSYMIYGILLLGAFTVGLCLFFLNCPAITRLFRPHPENLYLLTAFFALFIFSSVFNCFSARTDRLKLFSGIGKNPIFLWIMSAITAIQVLFVYLGGSVLRTAPLTPKELLITLALSFTVLPAGFLCKLLWRLVGNKKGY